MIRLLGCGSRTWSDRARVRLEVAQLAPDVLLHGAARGADTLLAEEALAWALAAGRALEVVAFPARWEDHGMRAGPVRNAVMLRDGKPTRGLAFGALWREKEGEIRRSGTGDMVSKMLWEKLPVRWIQHPHAPAEDLVAMPAPPRSLR
jgi:hypothetical protein